MKMLRGKTGFLASLVLAVCGLQTAYGQSVFLKYGPVAGIQKSTGATYQNTAAVSADIRGLWTGTCDATTFLQGAGACAQVSLTTNVTGLLPVANGGVGVGTLTNHGVLLGAGTGAVTAVAAMAADTLLQGQGASASPAAVAVNNCGSASTALSYSTSTHTFGCQTISVGGSGTVTSLTGGTGVTASPSTITATGSFAIDQAFSPTWTGTHSFSLAPNMNAGTNGTATVNGTISYNLINNSTGVNAVTSLILSNGSTGLQAGTTGVNNVTPFFTGGPTSSHVFLGGPGGIPVSIGTNGIERMRIASAGNVTINTPTSGTTLMATGVSGGTAAQFVANAAADLGLVISGGSGVQGAMRFDANGAVASFVGSSGATNSLITGSATGDFNVRTQGGKVNISTNSGASANGVVVSAAGAVGLPSLASTSAAQTGTVCWASGGGNLTVDTTVACLASTIRVKQAIENLDIGLAEVMKLRPVSYDLKPEFNPAHLGRQVGLVAEEVQKVDSRLVALDDDGQPRGVRYMQLTAVLTKAVQQQQHEIQALALAVLSLLLWNIYLTLGRRRV